MKSDGFLLDAENFSEMHDYLESQLLQLKIEQKDILRAELLVEEIFWRMVNHGNAAQVQIRVEKNFFGKVQIRLIVEGASYNPLVEVSDLDDEEDFYRVMILKANRQNLHWLHRKDRNVITVNVRDDSNKLMRLTLAGMVGGVICGMLMSTLLESETIAGFNETIIEPLTTMFLRALKMLIAPVIFFSVVSGLTSMDAGASVGRIGSKLIGLYLATTAVASIVGLIGAQIFFSGDVPQIGIIPTAGKVETYEFSMIQFIVDIIPANLVSPIADGNLIQIIFIAVLVGICLNALGDTARPLHELISNMNKLFVKMLSLIIFFVPLIVFFAMNQLITSMNFEVVFILGKLIIVQLICGGAMIGVYVLMIMFVGKISPMPFAKKIPSLWPVPFATSSSCVTIPFTMNLCTKKLGVSPKISSFSIPIGATVNMDGACIYLPLVVIMFLKMYGVEVNLNALTIIFAMTLTLSIGAPGVPNAAVICIISITSTFGLPADIAGILFCIGTICERIVTCFNVTGDAAATVVLARTENLLDDKIYFRN